MEQHDYNVDLKWISDRRGQVYSPELNETIEVATPPEFPKGMPGIWSPEHLFTAAVNGCFMTTFLAIAENSKLDFSAFSCRAKGHLGKVEGRYQMTDVVVYPELVIAKEMDRERAERVLQKTELACLISNSILAPVTMEPTISIAL